MDGVKTILYAEDDMVVLTVHRMRLQKAGFHVIAAHDGLDAIKKLSTFAPDLVLLDLVLPRFSGEEVLQFILSNPNLAAVPVIILSTNSVRDAAREDLLERASKRLIKSNCNSATLLEAIREVLNGETAGSPPEGH
jgi:chemosensory pili system protein ChpA (sensor histidine kinase/response regulator)